MSKEELEKEAEELIQRVEMANSMNCFMQLTPDRKQIGEMLVMIAEPREKRIAELKEENEELRQQCMILADCDTCYSPCKTENLEMKEYLTKAKEIIKSLCGMVRELNKPNVQLTNVDYSLSPAEQFLKEVSE